MLGDLIYLDHAATTPLRPAVLEAMLPYLTTEWGNPSSAYEPGRRARAALEEARARAALALGATPSELLFTGGGSEADNLAIKGAALAAQERGKHLITSAVEHHAVLHTCAYLEERHGFRVTYLPVDAAGRVDPDEVLAALRPDTTLVSVMLANNEVGTLQPVAAIAAITRPRGILFHTDAVQAVGAVPVDVEALGVDLLTISAHKFGGPKGVGALYVRRGVAVDPLVHGGSQEHDLRAGTENVAQAVGLAAALGLAVCEQPDSAPRLRALRDRLLAGLRGAVPDLLLTGHATERLPGHASLCLPDMEGEPVLIELDARGICASAGSACSAGSTEPSHVLVAMGVPGRYLRGALRLTLGAANDEAEVDAAAAAISAIVGELRALAA